jgi:hypothetical protein
MPRVRCRHRIVGDAEGQRRIRQLAGAGRFLLRGDETGILRSKLRRARQSTLDGHGKGQRRLQGLSRRHRGGAKQRHEARDQSAAGNEDRKHGEHSVNP